MGLSEQFIYQYISYMYIIVQKQLKQNSSKFVFVLVNVPQKGVKFSEDVS